MKEYFFILLCTGTLLTASQNKSNDEVLHQIHDTDENDPFAQTQGPDFFARMYLECSQRKDITDEDRQKYAQLAQQAASQVAGYRQRLNGMRVLRAQSK